MDLSASELIVKEDGSIYHLGLRSDQVPDHILVVGDPERVPHVSKYFDQINEKINHREFVSHIGRLHNKDLMVISSGMGTDNVEILITELDALVNIDLTSRTPRSERRKLKIIRIGTSGSLQEKIPVDSLLVSESAIGLDTLMCFYNLEQDQKEINIGSQLKKHLQLSFTPYVVHGSKELLQQFSSDLIKGNTLTCPGFYAPQGRNINGTIKYTSLIEQLYSFKVEDYAITNFEMETAGYYALCQLLGHEMISLNAILANRILGTFSSQPEPIVDQLIRRVLERI